MQHPEIVERNCDAERVGDLPGERKCFFGSLQRAVRITEVPIAMGNIGAGEDTQVQAVDLRMETATADLHALLNPIAGRLEFAEMKGRRAGETVRFDEHSRIPDAAGKGDGFVDQLRRLTQIGADVIDISEPS